MSKKYIDLNNAEYNFNNTSFEIILDLIDEEKKDIQRKKIIITKDIWYFTFPNKLNIRYKGKNNIRVIHKKIKEWLEEYANRLKDQYQKNWEKQPDIRKVTSHEINYNSKDVTINWC